MLYSHSLTRRYFPLNFCSIVKPCSFRVSTYSAKKIFLACSVVVERNLQAALCHVAVVQCSVVMNGAEAETERNQRHTNYVSTFIIEPLAHIRHAMHDERWRDVAYLTEHVRKFVLRM